VSNLDLLHITISAGTPRLIYTSGGGLKHYLGSFSWKWHLPEEPESGFEGSGPAEALPSKQSSTHTGLLGVLPAIPFLSLFCQFTRAPSKAQDEWCTSSSCYDNCRLMILRVCLSRCCTAVTALWPQVVDGCGLVAYSCYIIRDGVEYERL
jgi:hypothetical protein